MPVTIADSLTVVKSPDLPTFRTPELTVTPADRPARTGRSARKVVVPMRRWSWNLRQVGAPGAWDTTMGDPQVTVAVIDTGIDIHHPDLRGKVLSGADVVNPGAGWVDDLGHGTAVAGVIGSRGWRIPGLAGVAPGCRLLPIKCNIHGTTHVRAEHIAAGIRTAIARGAHVINLSVGVVEGEQFLTAEAVDAMADEIKRALNRGIVVVCAAGPGGAGPRPWPGSWSRDPHFAGLISVGGSDRHGRRSPCTPAGDFISVLAPADGVISTRKGGDFGPFGGTSAAAPHVAGIAALIRTIRPAAPPVLVRDWIQAGAVNGLANATGALALALRDSLL